MLNDNKILIKDSCIIFDLLDLGLMESFFLLGYEVYTTPQVISEITIENQLYEINKFISNRNLTIDSDGAIEIIQTLYLENPGLSYADCSVIELALRKNGVILSADKSLRKEANKRSLDVKGMLWLIKLLTEKSIISVQSALEKLNIYPQFNSRVPQREIKELCDYLKNN